MTNKSATARKTSGNGEFSNGFALPDTSAFLTAPGFALGQRMALEATRFWAKRMRAYAEQIEALAGCDNPAALIEVQTNFIKQMQADYAAESKAVEGVFESEAVKEMTSAAMELKLPVVTGLPE